MKDGEKHATTLDSNISKGHGDASSPSHPPHGRCEGVCVATLANETEKGSKRRKPHLKHEERGEVVARACPSTQWVWSLADSLKHRCESPCTLAPTTPSGLGS
jgi:hypothetical protein